MAEYEMQPTGKEVYDHSTPVRYPSDDGVLADEAVNKDASGRVTGTAADALDMKRLGRTQELRRNFKSLSILGLATTTMSTWVAMLATSSFSLLNGGLGGAIWLFVASWIGTFALASSLAELASMAPTSGGQYHWVSEFAPRAHQKFLSYLVGWLAALGWQALIATTAYTAAVLILFMVPLYHPAYVSTNWHQSLLMIAIGLIGTFVNTFGAKRLPILEGIILVFTIFGFFVIIIPLWVLAPKAPASEVFGSFTNGGGWPSIGVACFVGTVSATGSFAGSDAAAHLSEEVKDSSKTVPRMIVATIALNGIMGLIFIITYCFCITDLPTLLQSQYFPFIFIDVFLSGTGSKVATVCMTCIPIILSICTCLGSLAAASRQCWALARDQALPFSSWFRKVVVIGTPIPLNAILFSMIILVVIALINIGSSAALQTIFSLMTGATSFSYALSISCLLIRRLSGAQLPPARFSLGKFGVPVNIFAIGYIVTAATASFFPTSPIKLTAAEMNWSCVMFVGVAAIAMIDYIFRGRKQYVPPVRHIHQM